MNKEDKIFYGLSTFVMIGIYVLLLQYGLAFCYNNIVLIGSNLLNNITLLVFGIIDILLVIFIIVFSKERYNRIVK